MGNDITLNTSITTLIETIKQEIFAGEKNIKNTIEMEKTKTYWTIGKHIYEHLLHHEDKADYGDYLFDTLEKILIINKRTLYRAVQFYESYPKIVTPVSRLKWSHYLILLTVKDEQKRKEYEQRVIDEELSKRELQELIKHDKEVKQSNTIRKLTETRGLLNTYKLKTYEDNPESLDIDLGFRTYVDHLDDKNKYTKESIIRIKKTKNSYDIAMVNDISPHRLYTYEGRLKEIIDGDTLWVYLDLGFGITACRKIRLRGINAAKIETETGQKVKKYIEKKLNPCPFVIVKTYYRDKYNRYLADIFYDKNEKETTKVAETGVFLNQELLVSNFVEVQLYWAKVDKGFAEKY